MKTLIQVYRDGRYFVAVDLFTNVADPGNDGERGGREFKEGIRRAL